MNVWPEMKGRWDGKNDKVIVVDEVMWWLGEVKKMKRGCVWWWWWWEGCKRWVITVQGGYVVLKGKLKK